MAAGNPRFRRLSGHTPGHPPVGAAVSPTPVSPFEVFSPWPRIRRTRSSTPDDPVFRAHEGGKLGVHATQPLRDRADLSLLYTPGVADVSPRHRRRPVPGARYTAKRNTVAVVTDGTAVLGLGDIGPLAALPVMEGKAVLFKHFAGIDAVPVCMETGTVDELVDAIARIAPSYGGINLEDISAPRCFEIERRAPGAARHPGLPRRPARHGDRGARRADQRRQGGRARAGDAAGGRLRGRRGRRRRDQAAGRGPGCADIVVCDSRGIISPDRQDLVEHKRRLAASTNPRGLSRLAGRGPGGRRRVRRRLGRAGARGRTSPRMAPRLRSSSRSPTPTRRCTRTWPAGTPPWWPRGARTSRTRSTTCSPSPASSAGRSTPGATQITEAMKLAAAHAIADLVEEPTVDCIVPSVFQEGVAEAVAAAVRALAPSSGHRDRPAPA